MKRLLIATLMATSSTFAMPAAAEDQDEEHAAHLELFEGYLEISEKYLDLAKRKDAAVFFAIEGIAEIYENRGQAAEAIPILKAALETHAEDQAIRNVIRFKLRDLYRETEQSDLALAELQSVIDENR
ncbi:MAG: hypothetical protein AAFR17_09240 [Pseudomonadota bacterium]